MAMKMLEKDIAMKLIDSLQIDLKTLSVEAKKRHSNIKDSSEELLMRLRGAHSDPLGSLPLVSPPMIHLLLQGCETKDTKIVKVCLSALQKLIVNGLVDEKNTKHLSDSLWMLMEGGLEEVRVLQTVTLLLTTSDVARGITLSKCLVICFNLHFVRGDQTVVNTASATVRQLVSLVFERVLSEDKPPDGTAVEEPGGDFAAKMEDLKVAKGVPPKGLQSFAGDAFLLFQDLVSLVNGDQPSWLIGMNEMTRTFGLELLEMILSTYPAVFFNHPEFVFLLKERVCSLVIKLFSPNVKHQSRGPTNQQNQSQDKPYYPVSLRLLRLVAVLVQKYYKLLVTECEIFLSLLVKFLDPDRAVWQRCLALEALHKLLAQPNLIKSIVTSYDLKPHATPILQDTVNALAAYIQSVFVLPQASPGATAPTPSSGQSQGSQSGMPSPGSSGLSGFYYRGIWMPLMTNILIGPQRNTYLDILDKLEPPMIPDGYGISVAYACFLSVIRSITILIEEEGDGDGDIASTDEEEKKLKAQLINSSWCGLLTALSLLLEASTDEVGTDSLLKALECLTGLSGKISLHTPRDALVTAICKAALPPHYAMAVLGIASATKGHSRTGSTDQAYYQSLQQQASDNDYRPHVVAVGTPLPTPGMAQSLQQGPVMLTAKNLQVMRSILSLAQTHGLVLETSWNVVLTTLQHLSWILGIKPIAGAMKGGRNPLVDSNNVLTTAVMADLPIVSSMMAELFETSNRLDESSLRHLLDGLCKLSTEAMEVAYANREPSFFGIAKLLETSLVNLHRLELLWKLVTNHLLEVAFHPSLRLREWGVEALTSLIRSAVSVKFDPPLKQNQKIQSLLLGPLVDLSSTTHTDVRQRQLDCVLGVLHTCGESLTYGWPMILDIVGAVNTNQSESLVRAAFQCMQLVVTDFLPIVPIHCLPLIVVTVGKFGCQTQELNVSLTSIGMLWNVSDYFYQNRELLKKSMSGDAKSFSDFPGSPSLQTFDRLWMCLYMKLGDFCVDDRPAVRKSAGQTLFSTVSAHGGLLQNETWQAVFWRVLFPLLDKVDSLSNVASDQKVDANGTILMHHSRNTAQKQWAETQVLTLSGVARVFNSKRSLLHQLGDFDKGWTLILKHIEKGALSRNSEVSLSALKSLQELLLVNSKNNEKSEDQWLQAWTVAINIGTKVTTPSSDRDVFVPSQQFLTSLVLIFPPLFQHIKNRFTGEYLDRLFKVLNNVISIPVHSDASPFVLPPITDNVLTPLQEGILCSIDCIQDAATQGSSENTRRALLPSIFRELIYFVSFTCKVPTYASLEVRPLQTFRPGQGNAEWIQPNFVPFGEKALSMVVALYKKTARESTVVDQYVLTEIIKGVRVPLRLKHSHPSHSSWRIASEALIIVLRLGLEVTRANKQEDSPFWVELPVTLQQFLFPESSPDVPALDQGTPGNEDTVDCKIILLLKDEILKNPSSFPSQFLLELTKLLNRGSVQSIAFDCESNVRIREGFARVCFETLLQLSLAGLADFNFSAEPSSVNGNQSEHPNGAVGNGEAVTNRLAVAALLRRFEDVLKKYVRDERLGGNCPLAKHRVVEVTFVLQAISTLGRSLQNAQTEKVDLQTWYQLIALYPFLVELTEFASGPIGKSLRDALYTFAGLLTAPSLKSGAS